MGQDVYHCSRRWPTNILFHTFYCNSFALEYNFLFLQKKEITMKTIIHPTYFPNIEFFSNLLKSKNLIFEINDFYQKQTFRNRASIYGSNGKLKLIIPVSFSSSKKEKLKDIRICNNSNWHKIGFQFNFSFLWVYK